jgi:hypothetical protein
VLIRARIDSSSIVPLEVDGSLYGSGEMLKSVVGSRLERRQVRMFPECSLNVP